MTKQEIESILGSLGHLSDIYILNPDNTETPVSRREVRKTLNKAKAARFNNRGDLVITL